MENASQLSFFDELLGECHGGGPAIIVPNHVWHSGLLDGLHHGLALLAIHRERLFAKNHLASFGGSDGNFRVSIVRAADVDYIDIFAVDELSPVGLD